MDAGRVPWATASATLRSNGWYLMLVIAEGLILGWLVILRRVTRSEDDDGRGWRSHHER